MPTRAAARFRPLSIPSDCCRNLTEASCGREAVIPAWSIATSTGCYITFRLKVADLILAYTADVHDGVATFNEEETRHVLKVRRKTTGDVIDWIDGRGGRYRGPILSTGKRQFTAAVEHESHTPARKPYRLTLGVAPTKNNARLEWLLEKATEIGIDAVVLLACARSERARVRVDRLEKILLSAAKQSLKAHLPVLQPPVTLPAYLAGLPVMQPHEQRLIAHCGPGAKQALPGNFAAPPDVCILIGPEGDFTPEEIDLAAAHGFTGLTLGTERLRTETAALVAVTLANFALNR